MEIAVAANDNEPLGVIYKFEEAAEKLRVSKRRMQEIVKLHPALRQERQGLSVL